MKSIKQISILFFLVLFISCNKISHVEYKYYDNGSVKSKLSYTDDNTYFRTEYYENGEVYSEGRVQYKKKEGEWNYWYADGVYKTTVYYNQERIDYANPNRKPIQIILSDSLKIGKKTYIKVQGSYPEEALMASDNIIMEHAKDSDYYNYEITPLSGNSIVFYYNILVPVTVDNICLNNLEPEQQMHNENLTPEIYKMSRVEIKTFYIHQDI